MPGRRPLPAHTGVAILGGGVAGLAIGARLEEAAVPFVLLEASPALGGLARTLRFGDYRFDTGAHRFHDQDSAITGWVEQLIGGRWIRCRTRSAIYSEGRFIEFPLSPLNLLTRVPVTRGLRYVGDYVRRPRGDGGSFRDHAISRFGHSLADDFVLSYSEKLWGAPAGDLSPELGTTRLRSLTLATAVREAILGRERRNEHLDGSFYYPIGGFGRIAEALEGALPPERVWRSCPVQGIERIAGGYRLTTERGALSASVVVSGLPLPTLSRMADWLPPELRHEVGTHLRFRQLIGVFLTLAEASISPHASLYLPDPRIPITRVHEPRNRCPSMAPAGRTSLLAEVPIDGDPVPLEERASWQRRIEDETVDRLIDIGLVSAKAITSRRSMLVAGAYPVILRTAVPLRETVLGRLEEVGDLFCVGRAARFEYTHLHQIFAQAQRVAEQIACSARGRVSSRESC